MSWVIEIGLFLSIAPLYFLTAPRIKERKQWLFRTALIAESVGALLVAMYLAWVILSPFKWSE